MEVMRGNGSDIPIEVEIIEEMYQSR